MEEERRRGGEGKKGSLVPTFSKVGVMRSACGQISASMAPRWHKKDRNLYRVQSRI